MTRLFLIDHSLKTTGTHHFDLLDCMARGADDLGMEVSAGVHVRFPEAARHEMVFPVHRCFGATVYQSTSELAGLRQMKRAGDRGNEERAPGVFGKFRNWVKRSAQIRRNENLKVRFARECATFFSSVEFHDDDYILFLAVSEIELLSALRFLAQTPRTLQAQWNFLFHFNVFPGRPSEFARGARALRPLGELIRHSVAALPYHRLKFFATTSALATQYQQLGVPRVEPFAYPVSREFRELGAWPPEDRSRVRAPGRRSGADTPKLRFVVAGGVRREKGQQQILPELVQAAKMASGQGQDVELVLQRPKRSRWLKQKLELPPSILSAPEADPLVSFVDHPLPHADYVNLIQEADCGVLLYDSEAYAARRAGILGEFFACGKPVLVSAANWLSDQLEASHFAHAQWILRKHKTGEELRMEELAFAPRNVPLPGRVWSFDDHRNPFHFEFEVPPDVGGFVVEYQWHFPKYLGNYCRWEVEIDGVASGLARTVGQSTTFVNQSLFFPLAPSSVGKIAKVTLRNPTSEKMNSIRCNRITWLRPEAATEPIGAVGVVVPEESQLKWAMSELVAHYPHYRQTASAFGVEWNRQHNAERAIMAMFPEPFHQARVA